MDLSAVPAVFFTSTLISKRIISGCYRGSSRGRKAPTGMSVQRCAAVYFAMAAVAAPAAPTAGGGRRGGVDDGWGSRGSSCGRRRLQQGAVVAASRRPSGSLQARGGSGRCRREGSGGGAASRGGEGRSRRRRRCEAQPLHLPRRVAVAAGQGNASITPAERQGPERGLFRPLAPPRQRRRLRQLRWGGRKRR